MKKREVGLLLAAVAAVGALMAGFYVGDAVEAGAWGLSFQTQGQPPVGPAGVDELKKYDAVYVGDPGEQVIYLTFDAGYETAARRKFWTC